MESTTEYPMYDYEWHDPVNRPAFVGFWITFLILGCILKIAVIVLVIRLYVKRPEMRCGCPRLCVMLVYCVLGLLYALGPTPVIIHINMSIIQNSIYNSFNLKCHGQLAVYLSIDMFMTVARLLIAAVILLEAVRLLWSENLTIRRQMGLALALIGLSVGYCYVVIIPTFYYTQLEDPAHPCSDNDRAVFEDEFQKWRMFYIVQYLLPHWYVLLSCVLLVVGHRTRRSVGRSVCHFCSQPMSMLTQPHSTRDRDSGASGLCQCGQSSCDVMSPSQEHVHPAEQSQPGHEPFPFNLLLAAAVSVSFGLVSFVASFFWMDLELAYQAKERMSAAGSLLNTLSDIFVPFCWLCDAHLRPMWCWCRHAAHNENFDFVSLVEERQETGEEERQETGEATRV